MLLGLDSFSYHIAYSWGGMDVFAFVRRAHELGLDGAKINMGGDCAGHLGNADPAHLRKVRALAESFGMYLELDTRGTEPSHLDKALRICKALGGDVVRTYVSVGGDVAQQLDQAPRNFRAVLPLCEELGVRIALENHEYESSRQLVRVVEEIASEHIGLQVDTGNSMPIWEDPLEAVKTMAPHAISSHFKDQAVMMEKGEPCVVGVPLGRGRVDCAECFRVLAKNSPLRRINIQVCYGYGTGFKVPQEQGQGGKLGEGAFEILPMPYDASWVCPYPSESIIKNIKREQLIEWQNQAVEESVAFVKSLNKRFG